MSATKGLTETERNLVQSFLNKLKSMFGAKKEIKRIRVISGTQVFWVKNPKKIKFWKDLAINQQGFSLKNNVRLTTAIRITKVEYVR